MNSTFRRLAIAALAAFTSTFATFAASPAATQAWVADYVSTHAVTGSVSSSSAKVAPVSASITVDGTNYTYSFTMYFANEPTWKIVESTVSGMAVGTQFAIDSYGNACNYTNAACNTIYQSVSTNWTFVAKSWTQGGGTEYVSNRRDVVQLDFSVNGVDFRGYEDPRHHEAVAAAISSSIGIVKFRRSYVTPSVKTKLLTQPVEVSWMDLLFCTAHAAWVPGKWDGGESVEGGTLYKAHYYWDGESLAVDIPSVSAEGSAGTVAFQTGTIYEITASCDNYCNKTSISTSDVAAGLKEQLLADAQAVMDTVRYKNFERLMGVGKFDSQIESAINTAIQPYESQVECPLKKLVPNEAEDETPEDPPSPPSPYSCPHKTAYCNSSSRQCIFRCSICKAVVMEYDEHHFGDSSTHCAVCDNQYTDNGGKTVVCGIASNHKDDHIFSEGGETFGGDETGCRCKHGTIWTPHGTTSYVTGNWESDDTNHWKLKKCGTCGYDEIKSDEGTHYFQVHGPYYFENRCETSNICYMCKYAELGEVVGHVNSGIYEHKYIDDSSHTNLYTCLKCLHLVGDGTTSDHVPDGKYVRYQSAGIDGHHVQHQCDNVTGCGHTYWENYIRPHNPGSSVLGYETCTESNQYHYVLCACTNCNDSCRSGPDHCEGFAKGAAKITLVDDPDEPDYYPCRYCLSGHGEDVSHNWRWNSEMHWCKQDGVDMHLADEHKFVENICTVCGYNLKASDENEYKREEFPVVCKNNCCNDGYKSYERAWKTNGVEIIESERGPWNFIGVTYDGKRCHYNNNGSCKCPYCRGDATGLSYKECYCSHIGSDILSFCESIITGEYHLRYAGDPYLLIDFSDPVYEVGDGCFIESFVSMPNLTFVNASTITNVGYRAFAHAYTNDTKLADVWFSGLKAAGEMAFIGAFVKCPLTGEVTFDKLEMCGSGCFTGAFADTKIKALSFAALRETGGALDFFNGKPCDSVTKLSIPNLDVGSSFSGHVFVFADMPNLETLNLASASTNTINRLGDLSNLSKLYKLDCHAVAGIPSYYQNDGGVHAPTNNPTCLIVVPNDLCSAWRAAPGWSGIADQIVPYSNQVIRATRTVTFDSDYGDAVSPVEVIARAGIVAPTNIIKYADAYGGWDDGAFTLDGWYWDSAKTRPYTNGTAIVSNTTLYAKWTDHRQIALNETGYVVGNVLYLSAQTSDVKLGLHHSIATNTLIVATLGGITTTNNTSVTEGTGTTLFSSTIESAISSGTAKVIVTCPDGTVVESNAAIIE